MELVILWWMDFLEIRVRILLLTLDPKSKGHKTSTIIWYQASNYKRTKAIWNKVLSRQITLINLDKVWIAKTAILTRINTCLKVRGKFKKQSLCVQSHVFSHFTSLFQVATLIMPQLQALPKLRSLNISPHRNQINRSAEVFQLSSQSVTWFHRVTAKGLSK